MRIAFFVFFMCVFVAPVEAQLREDGYFVASGIDGWDYDSEYWIATGRAAIVPFPSNPNNARCVFNESRQAYRLADLERIFNNADSEESLRNDMQQRNLNVRQVVDVSVFHLREQYPTLRRIYFIDNYENIIIEYFIGGANGVVGIRCVEDHRVIDNTIQYNAALDRSLEVLRQLQILMPVPR